MARSTRSSRTRPSTRSSSRAASTRCSAARSPRASTPARCSASSPSPSTPSTRAATRASRSWTSRGSAPSCCSPPSAAASSTPSATTSRPPWRASRRSTAGSRTTGATRTRTASSPCPMISLADPEAAAAEVDRWSSAGARMVVHVRPAPVPGPHGSSRSLGAQEPRPGVGAAGRGRRPGGVPPGDSGYEAASAPRGAARSNFGFGQADTLSRVLSEGRAIHDSIASMVVHGVFKRHPGLQGRQHRERVGLGAPPGQAPPQEGQPDAVDLRRGSARHHPSPRLDHALPRGGPRARWPS